MCSVEGTQLFSPFPVPSHGTDSSEPATATKGAVPPIMPSREINLNLGQSHVVMELDIGS